MHTGCEEKFERQYANFLLKVRGRARRKLWAGEFVLFSKKSSIGFGKIISVKGRAGAKLKVLQNGRIERSPGRESLSRNAYGSSWVFARDSESALSFVSEKSPVVPQSIGRLSPHRCIAMWCSIEQTNGVSTQKGTVAPYGRYSFWSEEEVAQAMKEKTIKSFGDAYVLLETEAESSFCKLPPHARLYLLTYLCDMVAQTDQARTLLDSIQERIENEAAAENLQVETTVDALMEQGPEAIPAPQSKKRKRFSRQLRCATTRRTRK